MQTNTESLASPDEMRVGTQEVESRSCKEASRRTMQLNTQTSTRNRDEEGRNADDPRKQKKGLSMERIPMIARDVSPITSPMALPLTH